MSNCNIDADVAAWRREREQSLYRKFLKRAFDVVFALAALIVLGPVILLLGLLTVASGGGGSPFFAHERIGRNGVPFHCLKIRTMVEDADHGLEEVLKSDPIRAREWQLHRKLANDPRVTPLGRFLRQTSLDELPLFWNVLRGSMSLVGPRPVTAAELSRYGDNVDLYLSVRPGVTGPWQVERGDETFEARVEMDTAYAADFGFLLDVRLILSTIRTMFAASNQ